MRERKCQIRVRVRDNDVGSKVGSTGSPIFLRACSVLSDLRCVFRRSDCGAEKEKEVC